MSKRKTGRADALINTKNEHWNGYALRFLCAAKEGGNLPDLDKAMDLYAEVHDTILTHHDEPLKGDRAAEEILTKAGMNEEQRRDIYHAVHAYLKGSEFDVDLSAGIALLKGRTKVKEAEPWTTATRNGLQEVVRRELEHLPATMEQLEPKDRLAILCKLLSFTMTKPSKVEGGNDTFDDRPLWGL